MSEPIDRALDKVGIVKREISEAIGSLELAKRDDDRALITGYTGSQALIGLRQAEKIIEKVKERLEALQPAKARG